LKPLRVVFFGSPEFAVPVLEALARQHHVVLVVSQPAKPAGRGMILKQPAAAKLAESAGIALAQPRRLRKNPEFIEELRSLAPDLGVTAAYGKILPPELLEVPRYGVLNVHASLLPRWRGAAPIQRSLMAGDEVSGITIMQTEEGLDTGPIRLQRRVAVRPQDDAVSLARTLSDLGAEVLMEALTLLAADSLPLTPQDDSAATLAPPLTPEDGHLRWQDSSEQVFNRHRGVAAWPGTSFEFSGQRVKVLELAPWPEPTPPEAVPAQVLGVAEESLLVATGGGALELATLKPAGKGAMSARAWANGRGVKAGVLLV